jgi:uncharacterized membrane protein
MRLMNNFLATLINILKWTLRRAVFLVPVALIVAWASNPHGPLGGYFFPLGLVVLFPMHFLHTYIGPFSGAAIWMLALTLQLVYLIIILMCGRWFYVWIRNMLRDKRLDDSE